MNLSRRNFLGGLGATTGALALPGCLDMSFGGPNAQIAVQLYSIRSYIGGSKDKDGKVLVPARGLAGALEDVAKIGYKGVEFAGYYGCDAKTLKSMLDANGLKAAGTHIGRHAFGPDQVAKTCEFNLGYGNNLLICPGGGNFPGKDEKLDDFLKKLVDFYNQAAKDAAKYGCKVGLHNHTGEFGLKMADGTTYWDYFFRNTDPAVCMEQDVGWTTAARHDPCEQYAKYPHRSPTLHAKENGAGAKFEAILGQPGFNSDGTMAKGVDWDALIPVSEADGVRWYVVECERHAGDLTAISGSYAFLKSKGLR